MNSAEPVLVVGHKGLLGRALCGVLGSNCETIPERAGRFDLTDPDAVMQAVSQAASSLVINCAGYTAVDRAESEPEKAFAVNAHGAGFLAKACKSRGKHLVHISTDYVFDGRKGSPYREDDPVSPLSVYAQSKLSGEIEVAKALPGALIVRSAWLFGHSAPGFVGAVLQKARSEGEVRVVQDQVGSPTYALDLAGALVDLAHRRVQGVLHVVNSGQASRYEYARNAVKLAGLDPEVVRPGLTEDFPSPAARPAYSVLDTRRFSRLAGGPLPGWLDGLRRFFSSQKEESA